MQAALNTLYLFMLGNNFSKEAELVMGLIKKTASKWVVPNIEEERAEVERTAEELGIDYEYLLGRVETAIRDGNLVDLTPDIWQDLDNTESWDIDTEEEAQELSQEYNRDLDRILNGLKNENVLPAPIVMDVGGDYYYLIGGNTRLMAAHTLGLTPKVLIVDVA